MKSKSGYGLRIFALGAVFAGICLLIAGSALAVDIGNPSYSQVFLYEHTDYGGSNMSFQYDYDVPDLTRWRLLNSSKSWNDRLSSVKLGRNVKIILYEHINYKGASITIQADGNNQKDYSNLHSYGWGDKASSFKVRMCDNAQ